MNHGSTWRQRVAVALCVGALVGIPSAFGQIEVIGTHYRPDEPFPQFNDFWFEGATVPDDEAAGDRADYVRPPEAPRFQQPPSAGGRGPDNGGRATRELKLGGSAHLFVRNAGSTPAEVKDLLLGGISLNQAIAFSDQRIRKKFGSIHFADLEPGQLQHLIALGEPIWWKCDPLKIPPGGTAEVIVRLREKPASAAIPASLVYGTRTLDVTVPVNDPAPRLEGISFSPTLRDVYLYFRHPARVAPVRITLDGQDMTARATIHHDASMELTPLVLRLARPLTAGTFVVFGGTYADGSSVMSGLRAWSDELVYGMFGGKPGRSGDLATGKAYIDDLTGHNLNLQMPQVGSAAVQSFFKDARGQSYMDSLGFRFVLSHPGKFGIDNPYALYVHDEPDCGDFRAEGLDENKKIGAMARWVISYGDEFRREMPNVPQMLNLNMSYKPHNWYIYGQIPDIFAVDPYYQRRLKDAYYNHPERIGLYSKATYIYMVAAVAQSSAAPNPLHVILYGNRQTDRDDKTTLFRFPTPPEKRIEVYYALAAGAKGLSYWWYSPAHPAYGLGAATLPQPDPKAVALWREIGLVGAEVRTAGPVLTTSCPADVPVEAPDTLWVRCLAKGDDTLVVLVVNEQYTNTDKGTDITPVRNASATVKLPGWLKRPEVFEITPAGTKPVGARATSAGLRLPLGTVDVTRMFVLTTDTKLRAQLQAYYESKLAANTARLITRE